MTAISPPDRISEGNRGLSGQELTPGPAVPVKALLWLGSGASLLFLVPLIGTDVLGLQPDLYYLCYFTLALVFLALFAKEHAGAVAELLRRHARWSLLVGAAVGVMMAFQVFGQVGATHPGGWRYGFELVWRGLVYGSVDALTLYVFPAAVADLLLRGNRHGAARKAAFAGLALVLSLIVTATYHVGYREFRGSDLRSPEIGALIMNVPTILTGNPLGSIVAHSTMHVAAVVHQRNGGPNHMLPPKVTADYPDHGSSALAAGLAAAWLVATAGALSLAVRRRTGRAHVGALRGR